MITPQFDEDVDVEAQLMFALYRFFDANGQLLYVGLTTDPNARLKAHQRRSFWTEVVDIHIERYDNFHDLYVAEAAAIRTENPKYNIAGRAKEQHERFIRKSVQWIRDHRRGWDEQAAIICPLLLQVWPGRWTSLDLEESPPNRKSTVELLGLLQATFPDRFSGMTARELSDLFASAGLLRVWGEQQGNDPGELDYNVVFMVNNFAPQNLARGYDD